MASKLLRAVMGQSEEKRRLNTEQSILRHLARIGGKVFGPVPKGHRREFFCLDERTWVWHEEWIDSMGNDRAMTTRYDVRPNGILKLQGSNSYQRLSVNEEKNFRAATKAYYQRASRELQRLSHSS